MRWIYLPIPKLKWWNCWSLGISSHTLYWLLLLIHAGIKVNPCLLKGLQVPCSQGGQLYPKYDSEHNMIDGKIFMEECFAWGVIHLYYLCCLLYLRKWKHLVFFQQIKAIHTYSTVHISTKFWDLLLTSGGWIWGFEDFCWQSKDNQNRIFSH